MSPTKSKAKSGKQTFDNFFKKQIKYQLDSSAVIQASRMFRKSIEALVDFYEQQNTDKLNKKIF